MVEVGREDGWIDRGGRVYVLPEGHGFDWFLRREGREGVRDGERILGEGPPVDRYRDVKRSTPYIRRRIYFSDLLLMTASDSSDNHAVYRAATSLSVLENA